MRVCDNCWTQEESTDTERTTVLPVAVLINNGGDDPALSDEVPVGELCDGCRSALMDRQWSALSSRKRSSSVRRKKAAAGK